MHEAAGVDVDGPIGQMMRNSMWCGDDSVSKWIITEHDALMPTLLSCFVSWRNVQVYAYAWVGTGRYGLQSECKLQFIFPGLQIAPCPFVRTRSGTIVDWIFTREYSTSVPA